VARLDIGICIFNISLDYLLGAVDDEIALDRNNEIALHGKYPFEVMEEVREYAEYLCSKRGK